MASNIDAGLAAFGIMGLILTGLIGVYSIWLIGHLVSRLRESQAEVDSLRAERTRQAGEISDLEQKLQITLIENAMLSAKRDAGQNTVS